MLAFVLLYRQLATCSVGGATDCVDLVFESIVALHVRCKISFPARPYLRNRASPRHGSTSLQRYVLFVTIGTLDTHLEPTVYYYSCYPRLYNQILWCVAAVYWDSSALCSHHNVMARYFYIHNAFCPVSCCCSTQRARPADHGQFGCSHQRISVLRHR